jgi:hypothetical protein
VPDAEYKLYKKNETKTDILLLTSLGLFVTGGILYYGNPTETEKHPAVVFTLLGAGFTAEIVSGIFERKARRHFQKALWVYNKEVMVN